MIKNKFLPPILWLSVMFITMVAWDKDSMSQQFSHWFKQPQQQQQFINYSKFILAALQNDHKAIHKYGAKVEIPQVMPKVINGLIINTNFDTAIKKAKKFPESTTAKIILGYNAFKLKRYESAIKYLQNDRTNIAVIATILAKRELKQQFTIPDNLKPLSAKLNNDNPQNLVSMVMMHSKNAFFLNLAFFMDKKNTTAMTNIASLLLEQKQYELLADFVKNMPKTDKTKLILINLIDSIPVKNITSSKSILDLFDKNDKEYHFANAVYELRKKQYKTALAEIKKVNGYNNNYLFNFYYGIILEKNKLYPQAIEKLKIAKKQSNNDPNISNYLSYNLIEQNIDLEKNLAELLTAYKKLPEAYIADSVGWVYYKLGNYKDALKYMNIAINGLPSDGVVNDHLGDLYLKLGRVNEAIIQWNRAIELDPDNMYIDLDKIKNKIKQYTNE